MLEIYLLWRLSKNIGELAAIKGLKKLRYQIMAILLWICGEISGDIVGSFLFGIRDHFWVVYAFALFGALSGAGISFLVIKLIPGQSAAVNSINSEHELRNTPDNKFIRSFWIPLLTVLSSFSCLCLILIGAVFLQS